MYPFSSKDFLLDLIGEDDGRVPQIFISYALNYCCVFVIFSLFRLFFFRSSQTFSIKICSKYLYDATPNNTLWENAVYRYWFLVFMFWMYNLLFDFFKTTLFHGNNLATPTPKKIRQSKALFLVFMCISSVV